MNIFLTGGVQTGKSTAITRALAGKKLNIGGFKTVSRTYGETGELGVFIVKASDEAPDCGSFNLVGVRGSGFKSFPDVFDSEGCRILNADEKYDLILMDELGMMEDDAACFREAVLRLLDGDTPVLGVIKPTRGVLPDMVRSRDDCTVIELTAENRDSLPLH